MQPTDAKPVFRAAELRAIAAEFEAAAGMWTHNARLGLARKNAERAAVIRESLAAYAALESERSGATAGEQE